MRSNTYDQKLGVKGGSMECHVISEARQTDRLRHGSGIQHLWELPNVVLAWLTALVLVLSLVRTARELPALPSVRPVGPVAQLPRARSPEIASSAPAPWESSPKSAGHPDRLSAAEFSRLVRDLSEEGGFFRSDNFTSNETSYLHVVNKLRELGAAGGAYIGVGPEQNFTYIAKVRPRIAFIVDIRRQAIIQHLIFKAIFDLAPTRTQYLSLLLSKPLNSSKHKEKIPSPDASINDILAFFNQVSSDDRIYARNLATIRRVISRKFRIQLSDTDQSSLDYVYHSFRLDGLDIAYRVDGYRGGWFPTLRELILLTDQQGRLGNFLASKDDYDFVRDMQRRNLIIPVVGDFGGKKALVAVGDYLRKNGLTVTAFYTSNVEQYLFQGPAFAAFVENVRKLPITDRSLFIRAVSNQRFPHPARVPGHMITTILQKIRVFLQDYDEGRYQSYNDLVVSHYIAGEPFAQ